MAQFSEVLRIEAAIKNKSSQGAGVGALVLPDAAGGAFGSACGCEVLEWGGGEGGVRCWLLRWRKTVYPAKKKRVGRGLGSV